MSRRTGTGAPAARRRAALALAAALLTAATATACGGGDGGGGGDGDGGGDGGTPELTARDAYVPEPITGDVAAGFLTIDNTGDADDALTSVTSDAAGTVEIHETVDNSMRRVDELPVPADGELVLSRGGNHLMLLDLTRRPTEGETLPLTLHFRHSEPITLRVPVESPTHTGQE
ncbi:copper chaperone PCu(A)C [Streptomyces sp. 4N509B]|uniref:copper chaperone PCu(A)C n=1 Tax=Streptomyces sp. 4N509B TaxID=3457413 RepID=UPI003FD3F958